MAFTMITVTRTYKSPAGYAAQGAVKFTPSVPMVNGVTTISSPERVELDKTGTISIVLAANNDPSTTPSGTTYRVVEDLTGQSTVTYDVIVPYNAAGGTVNLATLAPVATVAPAVQYVSSVNGQSGAVTVAAATDATTSVKGVSRILGGTADAPTVPWGSVTGAPAATDATTSTKGVARILGGTADAPTVPWASLTGVDADLTGLAALGDGFPSRTSGTWGARTAPQLLSDIGAQASDADLTGLAGLGDGFPSRTSGTWAARSAGQVLSDIGAQATDPDLTGLAALGDGFPSRTSGTWAARSAGQVLSDIGAQGSSTLLTRLGAAPVTITYAASITPDASQSCVFYCTATGDITLAGISNGLAGQPVYLQITASGGARTLTITGISYSVSIPSGEIWAGLFRYDGASSDFVYYGGAQ